jgi:hypothetical protein
MELEILVVGFVHVTDLITIRRVGLEKVLRLRTFRCRWQNLLMKPQLNSVKGKKNGWHPARSL